MGTIKFSPTGRYTFLISFFMGTFLLILFWLTNADVLLILGFYYVMIAAVINLLVVLYELMEYLTDVSEKKSSGNSVLLLLLNIPVALLYLSIIFNFT